MTLRVVAIMPAFNEEERIARTVKALLAAGHVDEVLVVDDGSTDRTAQEAGRAGACVLRLARNHGKSKAVAEGISWADADVVLLVDADLEDSARLTAALLTPVLTGEADMTIAAWRHEGTSRGFGFVKGFARWLIRRSTGQRIGNPLSGQRAMRRETWNIWRGSVGFGLEVALTLDALRAGLRVVEVPLNLEHRKTGRSLSGFLHRGRQLWHILLTVGLRWLRP